MVKCHRCFIDTLCDYKRENPFYYTCDLKMRREKVYNVCFKSITTTKELCIGCLYIPTKRRTDIKLFVKKRIKEIEKL